MAAWAAARRADGNAVRRTGDIVEAHLVAELHTGGVTAMLAADAQVDVGTGGPSHLRGHLHQLANPF